MQKFYQWAGWKTGDDEDDEYLTTGEELDVC